MPQPKSSSGSTTRKRSTSSTAKKPAQRKTAAAKSTAAKKPAAAKASTTSSRSRSTARTTAKSPARKAPAARKPAAPKASSRSAADRDDQLRQNLAQLRDVLAQAVVIPAERVQAVLDDARKRGHIDPKGVQEIAGGLIEAGRKQAEELRAELEAVVGRGKGRGDDLVAKVTAPARAAGKRASAAGDPVLKQVDKVVRKTGLSSFPITAYDDLKVAQIKDRLGDLSKPELRKVRTYETKHANRKSVLQAIEKALG
jgi:hypothetical protein